LPDLFHFAEVEVWNCVSEIDFSLFCRGRMN